MCRSIAAASAGGAAQEKPWLSWTHGTVIACQSSKNYTAVISRHSSGGTPTKRANLEGTGGVTLTPRVHTHNHKAVKGEPSLAVCHVSRLSLIEPPPPWHGTPPYLLERTRGTTNAVNLEKSFKCIPLKYQLGRYHPCLRSAALLIAGI